MAGHTARPEGRVCPSRGRLLPTDELPLREGVPPHVDRVTDEALPVGVRAAVADVALVVAEAGAAVPLGLDLAVAALRIIAGRTAPRVGWALL